MRSTSQLLLSAVAVLSLSLLSGCSDAPGVWGASQQQQYQAPAGLSNWRGWYNKYVYNGVAQDSDINGEIGHSLSVSAPQAHCSGDWTSDGTSIISGTLPPGLTLEPAPHAIDGIPTERG